MQGAILRFIGIAATGLLFVAATAFFPSGAEGGSLGMALAQQGLARGIKFLNNDDLEHAYAEARGAMRLLEHEPANDAVALSYRAKAHGLMASAFFSRQMDSAAHKEWQIAVDLLKQSGRKEALFLREARPSESRETLARFALGRSRLGKIYFDRDMHMAAVNEWLEAVALLEVSGLNQSLYTQNLNNIAIILMQQGRPADALVPWSKLLKTYAQMAPSPEVEKQRKVIDAEMQRTIHAIDDQRRKHEWSESTLVSIKEALEQFAPLAKGNVRHFMHDILEAMLHEQLGQLLAMAGRPSEAARHLHYATSVGWEERLSALARAPYLLARAYIDSNYGKVQALHTLTFSHRDVDPRWGFETSLLATALLTGASRAANDALSSSGSEGPTHAQRELVELRRQVARRVVQASALPGEGQYDLQEKARRLRSLEEEVRSKQVQHLGGYGPKRATASDVAAYLRPGDLLLQYVAYTPISYPKLDAMKDRIGLFVLSADVSVEAIDLGLASDIDEAIGRSREWQSALDLNEEKAVASALELRKLVLDRVKHKLHPLTLKRDTGNAVPRIYVVPDGQISLIPFETLPLSEIDGKARYLVEDFEIVYLAAARDLPTFSTKSDPKASNEAWFVGDPAFAANSGTRLAAIKKGPLPYKASEPSLKPPKAHKEQPVPERSPNQQNERIPYNWNRLPRTRALILTGASRAYRAGLAPKILTDEFASEELLQRVQSPRVLMLATHGVFLQGSADPLGFGLSISGGNMQSAAPGLAELGDPLMRSTLLLSGVNNRDDVVVRYQVGREILSEREVRSRQLSEEELRSARFELGDGVLTAYEVLSLNLSGTELVAIVGCETGLGSVQGTKWGLAPARGEAVGGLRQAFLIAGAKSIIMSMSEVPEKQTIDQMDRFFTYWLTDNMPRYEAFRRAQLYALEKARKEKRSSHPFWWAGFVYLGDPEATVRR